MAYTPESPLSALPPLKEVIRTYGLQAEKRLGQNFLLDLNITRKIARAAGDLSDAVVLEVGPGPGGLTRALLEQNPRVLYALEKDARCWPLLEMMQTLDAAFQPRLSDALTFDYAGLARELGAPYSIVANLPYNIATPLLFGWLQTPESFRQLILMFQKEVAERLVAPPNTSAYSRLSVMTGWHMSATRVFDLPGSAFTPPPKVTSTVVRLTPKEPPIPGVVYGTLERVVAAAFSQRRKMLRSSLKTLTPDPTALLLAAGIDGTRRAESLTLEEFGALTLAYQGARV